MRRGGPQKAPQTTNVEILQEYESEKTSTCPSETVPQSLRSRMPQEYPLRITAESWDRWHGLC